MKKIYLTDEQAMQQLNEYMMADTMSWAKGLGLVNALSRRYGNEIASDAYEKCVRKIVARKPIIRGNEERFFDAGFPIPIERLKAIVADETKNITNTSSGYVDFANDGRTQRYTYPKIETLDEFRAQVNNILGSRVGLFKDFKERRMLTFGSCFANNIGMNLKSRGANVYTLIVAEDVNSSFNNVLLLRRVFDGADSGFTKELQAVTGIDYELIRDEFVKADRIIFTLGNIFHLEDASGPILASREHSALVSESVMETVGCIEEIVRKIKENTNAKLFISVSPIPISGYRGTEYPTALEADCASKSQLLTALRECAIEDMTYIPTFEIFRWLAAHQSFATFGGDDGQSRHLSQSHINIVMEALT